MENEIFQERAEKVKKLREAGVNPYPYKFDPTGKSKELTEKYKDLEIGKHLEEDIYAVAGRIMSLREHGKSAFSHIKDGAGLIQIYFKMDLLGEKQWEIFKKLDIGDFIGAKGDIFKTRTGEVTIRVRELTLLSKSMLPLPEKWHGLKDVEIRYRQRYLDMIANPEVKDTFYTRSCIIKLIRKFLEEKSFLEVETPMMHSIPGGAAAKPFKTFHNALGIELFMRIAPELYLKRLLVGGFERVFEINRNFRNEGISIKHNPEFTMLELYQAYADYNDMMDLTEEIFEYVAKNIFGTTKIVYQEKEIDFARPWKRISMSDSVKEVTGIDVLNLSFDEIKAACAGKNIETAPVVSKGQLINELFEKIVEPTLIQPTIIKDYPIEISPLAKKKRDDDMLVERFEVFIFGRETANAFSELNDPLDQKERFLKQIDHEKEAELKKVDYDYITALEHGMPPAGGLGIGIDRMVMFFTNSPSIRDVILFPQMRPKDEEGV
ncbi:MAG: lysine--tRNA ligase [Candidatus Firestonebacteria bacterium RIFOXYC2_FULL_39_67]|nr:MAG: lysine--tRNA ligase [Candidatus Firestonebacteria bacterium RIFOXYD2_FULL_39_29]OGF53745.1 MAG: lysine--tRNA ligase [Candidatus Firestonebacteria bacterium RifOxyC12_full_39_7]OGF54971.1 MAG: lysine--tRNA ligase [Candidatus Firestonebacteria bacterium RIFOXYC2_FULL_39_67]